MHMQKSVFVMLIFAFLAGITISHASVNVLAEHNSKANVNTGQDLAVDSFESSTLLSDKFVTSMDTYGSQMVGCAEFSGSLQNNMGSVPFNPLEEGCSALWLGFHSRLLATSVWKSR